MAFEARVYRVLIASPSDVGREREAAVQAIQAWNDQNAFDRRVALLPLRWETHAAPELGARPQSIINRQVVDGADIVVGIFWTRLGSPTGEADSGTLEEIERSAQAGKLVMLYFSSAKQDPDSIDLEQLAKLRDFRKKTLPNALVGSFSDHIDFREKFLKQIDIQTRRLISEIGEFEGAIAPSVTDIDFRLADANGAVLTEPATIATSFVGIEGFYRLPDFVQASDSASAASKAFTVDVTNKEYYRQSASQLVLRAFYVPLRWWLKNRGGVGARDVHIDLQIHASEPVLALNDSSAISQAVPAKIQNVWTPGAPFYANPSDAIKPLPSWIMSLDLPALQPQREISPEPNVLIGATQDCHVRVSATIYADTLATPLQRQIEFDIRVNQIQLTAEDVLRLLEPEAAASDSGPIINAAA